MALRVRGLADEIIRAVVGERPFAAGAVYLRQGRVEQLMVDPQGRSVTALVQGTRAEPYRVVVVPAGGELWSGTCSCPIGVNCKHVAAVLLAARSRSPQPPRGPSPLWEREIEALVRSLPVAQHSGIPLALMFEGVSDGERLRLRPVTRNAKGTWVRTGSSWSDLQYSYGRQPHVVAHRQALLEVLVTYLAAERSYYAHSSVAIHADELGPSLWYLLDRVQAAGVELVSGKGDRVAVVDPVTVALDLRREHGSGVSMQPVILSGDRVVDASALRLVGDPPHGVFVTDARAMPALTPHEWGEGGQRPALMLAPLAEPLDERVAALLRAGRAVEIPENDLPRFFSAYYPGLRQVVTVTAIDGTVTPPEVQPPVLALTVTFGSGLEVDLEWGFDYRLGDDDGLMRVSVSARPDDVATGAELMRDAAEERRLIDSLGPEMREYVAPHLRLNGMSAVVFTTEQLPVLEVSDAVDVTVIGQVPDFHAAELAPVIRLATTDSDDRDWFDLAVSVSVEGQDVPFDQLFRALAEQQTHLVLPSGLYLSLDVPELETLRQLIEEARLLQDRASSGLRISVFQAGLWEELLELGVVQTQSARWAAAVSGLLELRELEPPPVPSGFDATLRPYQHEGFHWLAFLWRHGLGGVLADDMGLGKTVQTLAMICHARESADLPGPFLVVAPTSVVGNWAREATRFAPEVKVATVTETTRRRGTTLAEDIAGADLVVTSYALFRIDTDSYQSLPWAGLILDEAQFVKNHQAKTYQCARLLPAPFKLAVTGTPLENSLMDLWALLSIVAPGLYPSPQRFAEDYRRPIERGEAPEMLARLRRRVRPLMLRRTKEQVVAELPPKQEQVLEVVLDPKHQKVYQTHLQRERRKVLGLLDDLDRNRFEILKSLTLLRQLSLAPQLVDDAYSRVPASKVEVLLETLGEVIAEGHRVLVFSQFTGFLKVVRDRLDDEGIRYSYLDGRTRKRPERIEEWKTGTMPVFLISLKAGGVGLNLTEADYCFILDPWWNPATEAQAVDRTHRIGQDKTVMVYRMVAAGTIEEKVMELKARKQALFDQVMNDDAMMSAPLSVEDIKELFG